MTLAEAISFIQDIELPSSESQNWADLGCGTGLFTKALAELLPEESMITAIDREWQDFSNINSEKVKCSFVQGDMTDLDSIELEVDGIMMANALHYVKDQEAYIQSLVSKFQPKQFLIIEYDNNTPNQWVPYPVSLIHLRTLFPSSDFSINILGERASLYQEKMYAASIQTRK